MRSAVTNGRRLFVIGNGKSPWARRWRDLVEAHAGDIDHRGIEYLTTAQQSLVRRVATIEVQLEAVEGQLSEGKAADLTAYASASGHLPRLLETLGIERRQPKDVTPDPLDYARSYAAAS
jgi:hypothetical protein